MRAAASRPHVLYLVGEALRTSLKAAGLSLTAGGIRLPNGMGVVRAEIKLGPKPTMQNAKGGDWSSFSRREASAQAGQGAKGAILEIVQNYFFSSRPRERAMRFTDPACLPSWLLSSMHQLPVWPI
jgi:hypothetical protein